MKVSKLHQRTKAGLSSSGNSQCSDFNSFRANQDDLMPRSRIKDVKK